MGLGRYRQKRDFEQTREPRGGESIERTGQGLVFVVQKHAARQLHYDFRLELDGVLKSWAVPKGPSLDPGTKRLAMHVEDHPLEYGSFEGVIPEGQYGGGTVMLWDSGEWIPEGKDPAEDYRRGRLDFRLKGRKLRGGWHLVRMGDRGGRDQESWLLIKQKDRAARPGDVSGLIDEATESVTSGRTLDEIAADRDRVWSSTEGEVEGDGAPGDRGRGSPGAGRESPDPSHAPGAREASFPREPHAQLATLVDTAPEGSDWLHEIKLDGYRILCGIDDGRARLVSRNGNDWTGRFQEIADVADTLPCTSAWIDGEIVVLDERGVSDFQSLQNALRDPPSRRTLHYLVFDLLHLDGWDLTRTPLVERKALLGELVGGDGDGAIRPSDHIVGNGSDFHAQACRLGLEGIVSKRAQGPYRSGRGTDWLKVKCTRRQELVVVGWTDPSGSRVGFGALVLGVHDDRGRLVHAGRVGTGFTDRTLRDLHDRLKGIGRKTSPLENPPTGAAARDIHWVEPELVAEVAFTEWTRDGRVRHPSFQGLREDKTVDEVVRERAAPGGVEESGEAGDAGAASKARGKGTEAERGSRPRPKKAKSRAGAREPVEVAGIRLSNPDRVLYPRQGITKQLLAEYYASVADGLLPHVRDRPLTLVRCPSGHGEQCFFQKHAKESIPDVVPRVRIQEDDGPADYMRIDGLPSVIALVQLGVLEFHVWGARADRLDRPDRLVLDLDPDPDLPWTELAAAALLLRERLDGLGLESFVRTTGGKGLHVVLPIERRTDWDTAKAFTRAVAEGFVREWPHRFIATASKKQRAGKIFIDYLRNAPNATAIGTWSTRAREGAPVAVPLEWDELLEAPDLPYFDVESAPRRLRERGDPWTAMDAVRQSITKAMLREVGVA